MSFVIHPRNAALVLLRWLVRLVLLAFVTLVVGALAVVVVLPRATHGSAMTVLTGSMTPTIPVGSIVLVRPADPGTLRVGDVATYQPKAATAEFITHRIVKIDDSTTPTTFIFKGDANRGADINPISAQQVRGKVWFHVPYLGAIRDSLHGGGGVTLLAMLLLGGYALTQLSGAWSDRRMTTANTIDVPVVVAEMSTSHTARLHGLTPHEAAIHWRAVLLDHNRELFRLVLLPVDDGLGRTLEMLDDFGALTATVRSVPLKLVDDMTSASADHVMDESTHRRGIEHAQV
jgi:signal peptidase